MRYSCANKTPLLPKPAVWLAGDQNHLPLGCAMNNAVRTAPPPARVWSRVVTFALLTCLLLPTSASAIAIAVQGRLLSAAGGPVADGNYAVAFRLYDAASAAQALWTEYHLAIPVSGGAMSVLMGEKESKSPLLLQHFGDGKARWLGVTVGADPELTRVRLGAVPFAIHALRAAEAMAVSCSGCLGSAQLAAGAVKAEHLGLTWAGSATKGGPATSAKTAEHAKLADVAKLAEKALTAGSASDAGYADKAGLAAKATLADQATLAAKATEAAVATDLKCTGCISSVQVMPGAIEGSRLATDLALSGKLAVGNTLTIDGAKGGDLLQAKGKGATVVLTNDRQLQRVRLQVAAGAPFVCDAAEMGALYFDSGSKSMMVCDGGKWRSASKSAPAFCAAANVDVTNKSYPHHGSGNCGPHYGDQTWMSSNDAYGSGQFGWHDSCGKTGPNPFCAIKYPEQVVISSYRVLLHSNPAKKCSFQGANDSTNGLDGGWTTLHGPVDFPSGQEGKWSTTFKFNNGAAFSWYRLHCPGSPAFALYEWEMFCTP